MAVAHALWTFKLLIAKNAAPTLLETLMGFSLGVIIGCAFAIVLDAFDGIKRWFLPAFIASQAIPTFAIAPLLIMWLGYGFSSKILVTLLMLFFPIASSLYDGLQRTPQAYLDLAYTMKTKRLTLLCYIKLPAALPSLGAGLRVAATIAPMGAIIGEWVGASQGLGFLMLNANARMQIDLVFAVLFVIIAMALLLYYAVDALVKKMLFWKPS